MKSYWYQVTKLSTFTDRPPLLIIHSPWNEFKIFEKSSSNHLLHLRITIELVGYLFQKTSPRPRTITLAGFNDIPLEPIPGVGKHQFCSGWLADEKLGCTHWRHVLPLQTCKELRTDWEQHEIMSENRCAKPSNTCASWELLLVPNDQLREPHTRPLPFLELYILPSLSPF